jgi:DNA-binding response OmpR family regulator
MPRVLIVDSDHQDGAAVADLLRRRGFRCVALTDQSQVASFLKAMRPDLIILETALNGESGFALCRQLKRAPETKQTPVLFISARASAHDREWALKSGGCGYLTKPVGAREMDLAVDAALKGTGNGASRVGWRLAS